MKKKEKRHQRIIYRYIFKHKLREIALNMAQNAKDKDLTYEAQRRKIEKMMENPGRIVDLPDTSMATSKKYEPPDFVRNVMGSSAGAGSGEFHVYRHLRRKEIMRLKEMEAGAISEELDKKFRAELAEIKKKAEERILKKKGKREKKKLKKRKNATKSGPG